IFCSKWLVRQAGCARKTHEESGRNSVRYLGFSANTLIACAHKTNLLVARSCTVLMPNAFCRASASAAEIPCKALTGALAMSPNPLFSYALSTYCVMLAIGYSFRARSEDGANHSPTLQNIPSIQAIGQLTGGAMRVVRYLGQAPSLDRVDAGRPRAGWL